MGLLATMPSSSSLFLEINQRVALCSTITCMDQRWEP